jgi:hypothetical protein
VGQERVKRLHERFVVGEVPAEGCHGLPQGWPPPLDDRLNRWVRNPGTDGPPAGVCKRLVALVSFRAALRCLCHAHNSPLVVVIPRPLHRREIFFTLIWSQLGHIRART